MKKPWYNKNRNTEQKEIFMKIRQARIDDLAAIMEVYAMQEIHEKKWESVPVERYVSINDIN